MKKLCAFLLLAVMSAGCIELAVGSAAVAGTTYVVNKGKVEAYADTSVEECFYAAVELLQEDHEGVITVSSLHEGRVSAVLAGRVKAEFDFKQILEGTSQIRLAATRKGLPHDASAALLIGELMNKLQK